MATLKLDDAPRLYYGKETAQALKDELHSPFLKAQAEQVSTDADWLVKAKPLADGEAQSYMHGSRLVSNHLQCLSAMWMLTYDPKYRDAAIRHSGTVMPWMSLAPMATNEPSGSVQN